MSHVRKESRWVAKLKLSHIFRLAHKVVTSGKKCLSASSWSASRPISCKTSQAAEERPAGWENDGTNRIKSFSSFPVIQNSGVTHANCQHVTVGKYVQILIFGAQGTFSSEMILMRSSPSRKGWMMISSSVSSPSKDCWYQAHPRHYLSSMSFESAWMYRVVGG